MIVLTIPNVLSLLRVPLTLFFLVDSVPIRVTILVLAALSDFLDGYLARREGSQSAFGAALDPITDKIFVFGVIAILFFESRLDAWQGLSLISRDFALGLFTFYLFLTGGWRSYRPRAFSWGKFITVAQYVVLTLVVLSFSVPALVYAAFLFLAIGYLIELLVRYHRG